MEVAIRFSRHAADYIREKRWHPSQEIRELPTGELEIRMTLSGLEEVRRWILSWGGHAIVLEPPALAEMVHASALSIVEANGARPRGKAAARN